MNSKPIPQRISAFLLCFALLVGLFPSAALAVGEENPVWTIDYPDETITIPAGYSLYTTKTGEESITPSTSTSENSTYNLTPYIQNTQQTLYLQASETGESAETVRTEITIPARPTAPTITTTSVDYTEETLTIMWSSGTLEYNWNSGQPNAVWYTYEGQPIKPVALNTMHWEEEKGGTVYIRSAATNNQFASEANFTNTVTVKARPAAPTELPTIAATTDSITVTAVANQEYKLGEDENWQSAGSNNQVVLSSLEPGTPYIIQYRTKAVVDRGNPGSNQFASCAAQITVTTNYAAPTGLNFMSTVPGEATATWGEVTGATSYTLQLYKGDEKVGGEVTTTGTSHTFTIDAAGTYCFTVKATGDDVDGEVSQNSSDLTFYEVKFDSTGGTDVPSQFVTTEEKPNQPDTPTKSGYAFGGWYKDENFDDEWS